MVNLLSNIKRFKSFFYTPLKVDFLIYTDIDKETLLRKIITKKKIFCIYNLKFGFNLFLFSLSNIFFFFSRYSYIERYILFLTKFYRPKLVISTFDNYNFIYKIKHLTGVKSCFIQNGTRARYFKKQEMDKKNFVDYKFLFGQNSKFFYDKVCTGKSFIMGSLKNNFIKAKNYPKNKRTIGFVSQFRITEKKLPEEDILFFLNKFCIKNNYKINIYMFGSPSVQGKAQKLFLKEKLFYKNILKCKKKLIIRESSLSHYVNLNKEEVIVNIDSTLGYEMLGKKKKIIFFSIRDTDRKYMGFNNKGGHYFGFPYNYAKKGLCWCNIYDEKIFESLLLRTLNENNKN